jgi:hypothetical protein
MSLRSILDALALSAALTSALGCGGIATIDGDGGQGGAGGATLSTTVTQSHAIVAASNSATSGGAPGELSLALESGSVFADCFPSGPRSPVGLSLELRVENSGATSRSLRFSMGELSATLPRRTVQASFELTPEDIVASPGTTIHAVSNAPSSTVGDDGCSFCYRPLNAELWLSYSVDGVAQQPFSAIVEDAVCSF